MGVRDTSLDAFTEIQIELGKRQQEVYDAIQKLGCPTNTEISKYMNLPINQVTPRTKELREKGLVTECEKRECAITHKTVWSWRIHHK